MELLSGMNSALTTNTDLAAGSSELGGITTFLVLKERNGEENLFPAPSKCADLWSAFPAWWCENQQCPASHSSMKREG